MPPLGMHADWEGRHVTNVSPLGHNPPNAHRRHPAAPAVRGETAIDVSTASMSATTRIAHLRQLKFTTNCNPRGRPLDHAVLYVARGDLDRVRPFRRDSCGSDGMLAGTLVRERLLISAIS